MTMTPGQTLAEWDRTRNEQTRCADCGVSRADHPDDHEHVPVWNDLEPHPVDLADDDDLPEQREIPGTRALTIAQACPVLGMKPWPVMKLIESGELTAYKADTGPDLIPVADVLRLAQERAA